ncbi:hypothetical protein GH714_005210 [Hevea brasiliensis]|uniref:Uncharacterized protein n=1 Tax=Hevea brasiliensis TaxID=3981 RepID=A0A6A6MZ04_HEVBR|nr:hypothetical protein GH714_005040 [Hevea brasiliensis]KAF2318324.1 hypothetical protein GH714_005210 [Hevea brasiliensis]
MRTQKIKEVLKKMQESDQEFVEEYQAFDFDEVDVKEPASKESDAVKRDNLTTDLNISKDSNLAELLDPKGISSGDAGYPGPSNPVAAANVKAIAEVSANGSVNHLERKELLLVKNNLKNQCGLLQDSNDSRNVSHKLLDMGSCSNFILAVENMYHVFVEFDYVDKFSIVSSSKENKLAISSPQYSGE